MPRNNRNARRRRDVRTVARKGSLAPIKRDTLGRGFDNLAKQLRGEVSADGGR